MLAAISWIDTYMFHPPHDEWNICIYMVAAASHIHANLQKQANPRFLFCTGPIAAPTRSADPVGARERFGGVKSVRRVYACTLHSPKVGTRVKCIGMIHDNCVTRCTRCACDSMRVQNIHAGTSTDIQQLLPILQHHPCASHMCHKRSILLPRPIHLFVTCTCGNPARFRFSRSWPLLKIELLLRSPLQPC